MIIEREERDGYWILRMTGGRGNALGFDAVRALVAAFEEAEAAPAIVLTGEGKMFSAGFDLVQLTERDFLAEFLPMACGMFRKMFEFPRPLIAAVNGHAIAGGAIIAFCGDHRLMASGLGRIGVPELAVGVTFPAVPLEIVRYALPQRWVQEAIYTAATYPTDESVRRGFVDEVVSPDSLLPRAGELARSYGAIPAKTFTETKRMLRKPTVERMDRYAAETDAALLDYWSSEPVQQGIREYLERIKKG